MKNPMLVRNLLGITLGLAISSSALAHEGYRHHHKHDRSYDRTYVTYEYTTYDYDRGGYGRVLDARPIYERVAVDVPRQSCGVRTVAYEERRRNGDSFAGTVVGGLVGAAIGHELGNGRGTATAAGGLIGASIGNEAGSKSRRVTRYQDEEVCRTSYRTQYEQRLVGYDVSYSYRGRVYYTRTDNYPGDRILVEVASRY